MEEVTEPRTDQSLWCWKAQLEADQFLGKSIEVETPNATGINGNASTTLVPLRDSNGNMKTEGGGNAQACRTVSERYS